MVDQVNATELAELFGRTKGAVSQWVSSGKLDGCWTGEGRRRRFDVRKCAAALGVRMDPGQRLGNAAATDAARQRILADAPARDVQARDIQPRDTLLAPSDDDRYKLARIQKAEEEARAARRRNAEEEGRFVLRESMEREVARLLTSEIGMFEAMLTAAARSLADELKVDFKEARRILRDHWRRHRASRSAALALAGPALAEDEAEADF